MYRDLDKGDRPIQTLKTGLSSKHESFSTTTTTNAATNYCHNTFSLGKTRFLEIFNITGSTGLTFSGWNRWNIT